MRTCEYGANSLPTSRQRLGLGTKLCRLRLFFSHPIRVTNQDTLPENVNMPCAKIFAVCFFSGTRQKDYLPCASKKTHGKEKTNGKPLSSPCANPRHTANTKLCRVSPIRHTAKTQHVTGACSCHPVPSRCVTEILLRHVPTSGTRQNLIFVVCRGPGTRRSRCAVRRH